MFAEGLITMNNDGGNAMSLVKHAAPPLPPRLAKVISRR